MAVIKFIPKYNDPPKGLREEFTGCAKIYAFPVSPVEGHVQEQIDEQRRNANRPKRDVLVLLD